MTTVESTERRDWNWDSDGELDGQYIETRPVTIKNGPSAGRTKLVFDFHVGLEDELVSVFEASVIRSKFTQELQRRKKGDFEPGERMRIKPLGWKDGANGKYRDFEIWFEHAAPKPTAADLLNAAGADDEPSTVLDETPPAFGDEDIPW
jgi:hypothetical protein